MCSKGKRMENPYPCSLKANCIEKVMMQLQNMNYHGCSSTLCLTIIHCNNLIVNKLYVQSIWIGETGTCCKAASSQHEILRYNFWKRMEKWNHPCHLNSMSFSLEIGYLSIGLHLEHSFHFFEGFQARDPPCTHFLQVAFHTSNPQYITWLSQEPPVCQWAPSQKTEYHNLSTGQGRCHRALAHESSLALAWANYTKTYKPVTNEGFKWPYYQFFFCVISLTTIYWLLLLCSISPFIIGNVPPISSSTSHM